MARNSEINYIQGPWSPLFLLYVSVPLCMYLLSCVCPILPVRPTGLRKAFSLATTKGNFYFSFNFLCTNPFSQRKSPQLGLGTVKINSAQGPIWDIFSDLRWCSVREPLRLTIVKHVNYCITQFLRPWFQLKIHILLFYVSNTQDT